VITLAHDPLHQHRSGVKLSIIASDALLPPDAGRYNGVADKPHLPSVRLAIHQKIIVFIKASCVSSIPVMIARNLERRLE
jgi:hypothetical protein